MDWQSLPPGRRMAESTALERSFIPRSPYQLPAMLNSVTARGRRLRTSSSSFVQQKGQSRRRSADGPGQSRRLYDFPTAGNLRRLTEPRWEIRPRTADAQGPWGAHSKQLARFTRAPHSTMPQATMTAYEIPYSTHTHTKVPTGSTVMSSMLSSPLPPPPQGKKEENLDREREDRHQSTAQTGPKKPEGRAGEHALRLVGWPASPLFPTQPVTRPSTSVQERPRAAARGAPASPVRPASKDRR
ncbi:hypothetical protein LZ31DRAFT_202834 [Colletotrichum somersetense]|nr:hypothetical protein LZ31DRAFT_202834 [Colletotrichum somersetense]